MGGLAIDINDDDLQRDSTDRIINFFPMKEYTNIQWEHGQLTLTKTQRQRSRLTLTPDGLRFLKEKGHDRLIPKVSEERIKDKSKGSAFAKTLVCFQGLYLVLLPFPDHKLTSMHHKHPGFASSVSHDLRKASLSVFWNSTHSAMQFAHCSSTHYGGTSPSILLNPKQPCST